MTSFNYSKWDNIEDESSDEENGVIVSKSSPPKAVAKTGKRKIYVDVVSDPN